MIRDNEKHKTFIDPESIIGIFDLDKATESFTSREFLRACEKKKILISLSRDIPRSIVITDKYVYLVDTSPKTLISRYEKTLF